MNWALNNFSRLMELFWEHTVLSTIPTLLGLIIAVPLGLFLNDRRYGRRIAVALASIAFTIPSWRCSSPSPPSSAPRCWTPST
ncbi:hypothetical protein [Nesterenkonia pannonica]|uniref:hypothetical protein n=1 Tax=Nesterenkonia pannonica TaxID=1548602 RepID=UPI0021643A09|nr:hypothetical protein [Nesterenkonia pannonica]